MALKREQIEDPEVDRSLPAVREAIDWQPDDPRLPELADRLAASISTADDWGQYDADDGMEVGLVELLDSFFVDAVPVARRLMQLLEERGWSGWTQLEPVTTDAGR